MKLKYELSNGKSIKSPTLTEDEANEIVNVFVNYVNDKSKMSGGYLTDGANFIDISSVLSVTAVR